MADTNDSPAHRSAQLVRHFFGSVAIPAFAWIKTIELAILAGLATGAYMAVFALVFTLSWVFFFDEIEDVATEAVDEVTQEDVE